MFGTPRPACMMRLEIGFVALCLGSAQTITSQAMYPVRPTCTLLSTYIKVHATKFAAWSTSQARNFRLPATFLGRALLAKDGTGFQLSLTVPMSTKHPGYSKHAGNSGPDGHARPWKLSGPPQKPTTCRDVCSSKYAGWQHAEFN